MKTKKCLYGVFAVVAAQLLWLGWNYVDRAHELATAPTLHIECRDVDPRDLFRGDYVSLSAQQLVTLELAGKSIHWGERLCHELNTGWSRDEKTGELIEVPVANPLPARAPEMEDSLEIKPHSEPEVAVFWRKDADGISRVTRFEKIGAATDVAGEGEMRNTMWLSVIDRRSMQEDGRYLRGTDIMLSFFSPRWKDFRYYVEEKTGDPRRIWTQELGEKWEDFPESRIRRTVDVAIRKDAAPVPRMLYLNGVPYAEAIEMMRNRTFKYLP